ncbi:MAG: PQQ-binding-like beta-propeller repeat protein, partial [Solirubrobacterales bacterium]
TTRRILLAGGLAALLAAGIGVAAYSVAKRPSDVSNVTETAFAPRERKQRVKTGDWPVYGYDDQRTRYLPAKEVRPPYRASTWSFQAGKLLEFSPIVVDGRLYFIDKDGLFYALDAANGKVQWKRDLGSLSASSPAYADGTVFAVTLEPGQAVAMRARDGKVRWSRPLPSRSESSPVVFGKKVVIGTEDGTVYAFDRDDGQIAWQVDTAGAVKAGLALDDGTLYGANYAGEVFAINAASGAIEWKSSTQGLSFDRGGPVYSTPAVAFGRVYLGSIDNRVYSFDAETGEIAWSHSTGDWAYPGVAVADTDRAEPSVYIGSKDQNFYALDAKTGDVRWQKDVGGIVLGAASVVGEVVYVGVIGPNIGTFGFDAKTGKKVFEHELGEYNPVVSDGRRLYLTGASGIRAFEHKERKRGKGGRGQRRNKDARDAGEDGKRAGRGKAEGRRKAGGDRGRPSRDGKARRGQGT